MLIYGKSKYKCPEFSNEIENDGFAIFSKEKAKQKGYYPTEFPDFEDLSIDVIKPDNVLTIRAFFKIGKGKNYQIDSGLIDVLIENVQDDEILANILTELPATFPLQKDTTIVLNIDELLYYCSRTHHGE
ncbi:MAG: hypothetical protein KAU60_06140 [Desulfobacterales bacterium]|nr:hypothetical protein [Desulfobacterales bacterium]